MRDYLFRGKVLETEAARYSGQSPKWAVGNLHRDPSSGDCSISDYDTCFSFSVDPKTVGQFTGLHDSKGVKIFEGDILEYYLKDEGAGYVFYKYDRFVISDNRPSGYVEIGSCSDWEVIGNIHDNKDLLNEK